MEKSLDLKKLFHPRSVALIGASTEQNKLSGRPFRFFREYGYAGNVYPVNPKYPEIAGVPCFANLSDIPGEVDLAVITLPATAVPQALEECGAKGVKAAAIISSGFAEVGGEGVRLQEELTNVLHPSMASPSVAPIVPDSSIFRKESRPLSASVSTLVFRSPARQPS